MFRDEEWQLILIPNWHTHICHAPLMSNPNVNWIHFGSNKSPNVGKNWFGVWLDLGTKSTWLVWEKKMWWCLSSNEMHILLSWGKVILVAIHSTPDFHQSFFFKSKYHYFFGLTFWNGHVQLYIADILNLVSARSQMVYLVRLDQQPVLTSSSSKGPILSGPLAAHKTVCVIFRWVEQMAWCSVVT